jgi:hypothetical protein
MKGKLSSRLADSMASIAASCPVERLGSDSRYLILADLRMGDGGKKDELFGARKALVSILGDWYLPRGYTLVLGGDVEDLRRFWLKDIAAAWKKLYAVFDAYDREKRLRKIVGDRDLALTLLGSYPYELIHGLKLEAEAGSILILHGHQASRPYIGRPYLEDYLPGWKHAPARGKRNQEEDARERSTTERRLYRASRRLGLVTIEGHTRRPLFESLTRRQAIKLEVARLAGELVEGDYLEEPCLFSPGRMLGGGNGPELRMLEIEGDRLSSVRWSAGIGAGTRKIGGGSYLRRAARTSSIEEVFSRVGRPVPVPLCAGEGE